jgi:hypothetical protein
LLSGARCSGGCFGTVNTAVVGHGDRKRALPCRCNAVR